MAPLPPQQRKKRRLQLRDAQRRRRARLKDEHKTFLQIILNAGLAESLRRHSDRHGVPMHLAAADLLRAALDGLPRHAPAAATRRLEGVDGPWQTLAEAPTPVSDGQLELFP